MKGWKVLVFNTLVAIFGVLMAFDWTTVIQDPEVAGLIIAAIGGINAFLRLFTTTAIGQKE